MGEGSGQDALGQSRVGALSLCTRCRRGGHTEMTPR